MTWLGVAIIFAVAGLIAIFNGVRWKRGRLTELHRWHQNPELPFYIRNAGFAMLPIGAFCLLIAAVFPIGLIDELWAEYLGLSVTALAMVVFLVGLIFMIRPPAWLGPHTRDSDDGN